MSKSSPATKAVPQDVNKVELVKQAKNGLDAIDDVYRLAEHNKWQEMTDADKHRFKRIQDNDVEMLRGKSSRAIIKYLHVPMWRIPVIARDMRRLKSESINTIPLFTGVDLMLQELSQLGVALAVVSSDAESNARKALGEHAELISQFACGASLFGKAAKFKVILKRTGIAATNAICIGDELRDGEAETLASCYRACLAIARERDFATVAFPAISTGVYGFPRQAAARIAVATVAAHLAAEAVPQTVIFVCFDRSTVAAYEAALGPSRDRRCPAG